MTAARPQCDHCRLRTAGRCRRCDPPFPPGKPGQAAHGRRAPAWPSWSSLRYRKTNIVV